MSLPSFDFSSFLWDKEDCPYALCERKQEEKMLSPPKGKTCSSRSLTRGPEIFESLQECSQSPAMNGVYGIKDDTILMQNISNIHNSIPAPIPVAR